MIETLKTVKRNFATLFNKDSKHISYSQCGEDLIINFIFNNLGIINPSYLDIGAHHPTYLSNTYSFYRKGCQGVCVEPDPVDPLVMCIVRIYTAPPGPLEYFRWT
ncbi:MAG: hypothetical protein ACKPEQ_09345, partial [Dolichospermum sp.]